MSTFNGLVAEFPDIRVDFFRPHPELRPPLACFLSHIHSDHLAGLETFRAPFIYCSAATKEMLLRLERYPCRINYASGILETRTQRYRHLKNLLKSIPLDTSTVLELEPGNHLQVTLFDANHCPGAVMFLFEGQGQAALYTGDIRSEPWFVNAIARSPSLIEYTSGLKTLDTIYLDTSFIDDLEFPTKSEGISELLRKVSQYPAETVFHFQAWTYGYEDVWVALSKVLRSKIHVDEYKMLMFRSLVATHPDKKFGPSSHLSAEAPGLVGFMCGNTYHPGCLTRDETVRLHSCEKGNYCATVKKGPVVWIRPIITRLPDGQNVAEMGVGGGGDDLKREAELDYLSPDDVGSLLEALRDVGDVSPDTREQFGQFLFSAIATGRKVPIDLERAAFGEDNKVELIQGLQAISNRLKVPAKVPINDSDQQPLPNVVEFPYSRHSSYSELCNFVKAFKPKDVWPCTVDLPSWLREGTTIKHLFSEYCSGDQFRHDKLIKERFGGYGTTEVHNIDSQVTAASASSVTHLSQASASGFVSAHLSQSLIPADESCQLQLAPDTELDLEEVDGWDTRTPPSFETCEHVDEVNGWDTHTLPPFEICEPIDEAAELTGMDPTTLWDSQDSVMSELALDTRFHAFQSMLVNAKGKVGGEIGLLSTTDNHSKLEHEF